MIETKSSLDVKSAVAALRVTNARNDMAGMKKLMENLARGGPLPSHDDVEEEEARLFAQHALENGL